MVEHLISSLVVTSGEKSFKVTKAEVTGVEELAFSHEEDDIQLIIHSRHDAKTYPELIIISEDTSVFLILLNPDGSRAGKSFEVHITERQGE